jgi:acyl-CoA synthetase (NDP forming)
LVKEIPEPVELAVICLPGAQVLDAAASCLEHGVPALCVISSGFAETGEEGRERQEQLLALVRAYGARLVGPNCLGIASSSPRLNATFAPRELPPGRIGFSSQSGALGLALLEKAAGRNLGFSSFVSIGNKADVSSNDLLEGWKEDPETDLVLLYLESFGNPRKFRRIARRVARRKQILALKAGSTGAGARAASSHTAALAGSETAVDAIFRQAGVIRVRTLEELVDAASLFSSQPLPGRRRVGVMTNAGGLGICADACEAVGLSLPHLSDETRAALAQVLPREASLDNPVGAGRSGHLCADRPVRFAGDRRCRGGCRRAPTDAREAPKGKAGARRRDERRRNAVVLRTSGSLVAAFPYPESAAHALGLGPERAGWLRRTAEA